MSLAKLSHTLASGVAGGDISIGSFQTRPLNTKDFDPDNIVTLSANQFTLQAGTYRIQATSMTGNVRRNQARIRNITDSSTLVVGTSMYCISARYEASYCCHEFTLSEEKTFEFQHFVERADSSSRTLGRPSVSGLSEVYANVMIEKI